MGGAELNKSWGTIQGEEGVGPGATAGTFLVPPQNRPACSPRVIHLRSLQELRAAAAAWDDLWQRSEVTFPTMRAELLAQWVEHFASDVQFHAIAIEQEGRWAAALPLIQRKIGRLIPSGVLPCNQWSSCGDFLLDTSNSPDQAADLLCLTLTQCRWPLLWLDETIFPSSRWQTFKLAIDGIVPKCFLRPRWQVGRVRIQGDWQSYQASWSRKHRQHMSWSARQLARQGEVRLVLHSRFGPGEAASLMRHALEIEDLGWKHRAGGSILSAPGMSDFFIRQAEQLAAWGQLEMVFLYCGSRSIAFVYGQSAKGIFHSAKIGYDPEYARFSPGQLLRYFLFERFHAEAGRVALDFLGPLTEAHAHWRPETYTVSRLAAALNPLGRMALWAYKHWPNRHYFRLYML